MTADPQTIAYFDRCAVLYADGYARSEADADLQAFMDALPDAEGRVLDWGCGPGNSAAIMSAHGIEVDAVDASPGMAGVARELGVAVRVESIEDLSPDAPYRGIWANFSLIHCPADRVPRIIASAADALVPGGILHLGIEEGDGDDRAADGVYTAYWQVADADRMVRAAGLVPAAARRGRATKIDGTPLDYIIHLSRKPGG